MTATFTVPGNNQIKQIYVFYSKLAKIPISFKWNLICLRKLKYMLGIVANRHVSSNEVRI